jgi:prepilin-type N-terminal cleavage/methylation domain-containing protein
VSRLSFLSASQRLCGGRISYGFTLIELATVIVIIAILTAIALPSLAQSDDLSASAAAREVLSDLLYAQSQAIATGQYEYVSFNLNGPGGYSLYSQSAPTTVVTNPTTLQPFTVTMGTGSKADVALAEVTLDAPTNVVLAFDPVGCPCVCSTIMPTPPALAATGTIKLTCGTSAVTLSIEPDTGNITLSP